MPSKPSSPLSVSALFWRSVNRLRHVKVQAESPHTTRWRLVRLYFDHARDKKGLRNSVLANFANRIQDGRLSIQGAERLPPQLLNDLVKIMHNDGVSLARLIVKGKNPTMIRLAAKTIEENPKSHEAAAETLLRNDIPETGLFMKKKMLRMIALQPGTSEKIVGNIINALTQKTLERRQMVQDIVNQKPLSAADQGALGKDPTMMPSEFLPITSEHLALVKIYSPRDINRACQIVAAHSSDKQENILQELAYTKPELADLIRDAMGLQTA